jgi:hypothetical protein
VTFHDDDLIPFGGDDGRARATSAASRRPLDAPA